MNLTNSTVLSVSRYEQGRIYDFCGLHFANGDSSSPKVKIYGGEALRLREEILRGNADPQRLRFTGKSGDYHFTQAEYKERRSSSNNPVHTDFCEADLALQIGISLTMMTQRGITYTALNGDGKRQS